MPHPSRSTRRHTPQGLALVLAACLAGCASHTGKLPKAPPFPSPGYKPSIAVQVERYYATMPAPSRLSMNRTLQMARFRGFMQIGEERDQARIVARLRASGLFSRVVSLRRRNTLPPARDELGRMARLAETDVCLIVEPDEGNMVYPFADMARIAFILPAYESSTFNLSARARYAEGGPDREHLLSDSVGTFYWLPLFPMLAINPPQRLKARVNDNLLDTLVLHIYEEAISRHRAAQLAPHAGTEAPLAPSAAPTSPGATPAPSAAAPDSSPSPVASPAAAPGAAAPLTPAGPAPAVSR